MNNNKVTSLVLGTSLLCSALAYAGGTAGPVKAVNDRFSVDLGLGYLQGKGQEFVYDGDYKLSQLNWRIQDAAILKGSAQYRFNHWLSAQVSGWTTLGTGQAEMDDYDWLIPTQTRWSDWSHHNDTDLNYANSVDLNLQGMFYQKNNVTFGALVGYQWTNQSFTAKGGCFNYFNGQFVGCFPAGELGIGYQQQFETAYLGLKGSYLLNKLLLTGTFKYGPYVKSSDVDQHYQRNLTFTESSGEANFYSASITGQYPINHSFSVFAEATYDYFSNGRADMRVRDNISGQSFYEPDSAGLNAKQYYGVIGIKYKPGANA